MAILITEARWVLANAVLHCGTTFNDAKLDYAIIETGERLIHETGLNRAIATAVTVTDNKEVNISTTTSDFLYYDNLDVVFIAPGSATTSWRRLNVVTLDEIRALHEGQTDSSEPEFLAWVTPTTAWVYPTPDAVYTLNLPYSTPLTTGTWTAGTQGTHAATTVYRQGDVVTDGTDTYRSKVDDNENNTPTSGASDSFWQLIGASATYPAPDPQTISLNVDMKWAIAWLRTGARAQLLYGAPGHPETDKMAEEFERLIHRIEIAATPDGAWWTDNTENFERSYGPFGIN